MAKLATEIGVTRTSLYKSLAQAGHPRFETIFKITRALGCKLAVV
jgi:probable addiction module antidote protein